MGRERLSFLLRRQSRPTTSGVCGSPRSSATARGQSRRPRAASNITSTPPAWWNRSTMRADNIWTTNTTESAYWPAPTRVRSSTPRRGSSCWRSGGTTRRCRTPGPGPLPPTASRTTFPFQGRQTPLQLLPVIDFVGVSWTRSTAREVRNLWSAESEAGLLLLSFTQVFGSFHFQMWKYCT